MPEYGYFICGKSKSKSLKATCPTCGSPFDLAPHRLNCRFGDYQPIEELGRVFYGTVLLATNQIGKKYALKVCSSAQYEREQKDFKSEIQKYLAVGDHRNIAELLDGGQTEINILSRKITVRVQV